MDEISREEEMEIIERALVVGWELAIGRTLTTTDLIRRFGISRPTAIRLLDYVSVHFPIIVEPPDLPGGPNRYRKKDL